MPVEVDEILEHLEGYLGPLSSGVEPPDDLTGVEGVQVLVFREVPELPDVVAYGELAVAAIEAMGTPDEAQARAEFTAGFDRLEEQRDTGRLSGECHERAECPGSQNDPAIV